MVPERVAVDNCFKEAVKAAQAGSDTLAIVYALEGVARQIRDADDTQANGFDNLITALNETAVVASEGLNSLEAALNNSKQKGNRFL